MSEPGRSALPPWYPRDLRHRHARAQVGILARAFDDAAPARIARDVDHRREGPVQAGGRGLLGGDARGALRALRRPASRHRQRHREDRAVAVDHVHGEQQRDAEPRFLDRDLLQPAERLGAGDVQIGADRAGAHALELGIVEAGVQRLAAAARALHELAELFVQRHLPEQDFRPGGCLRIGMTGAGQNDDSKTGHGCVAHRARQE